MKTLQEAVTTEGFRLWLALQDPQEEFSFNSRSTCAFARYLRAAGFPDATVGLEYVNTYVGGFESVPLPPAVIDAFKRVEAQQNQGQLQRATFGEVVRALDETVK